MDEDWDSNNKNSEDAHMLDLGNERSTHKSRKQHDPWVFENPHTIGEACLAQSMLSTLKGEHTEDGSFFDWALTPLSVAKINQLADTAYQQGSRLIRKIRQFALHATWFSSEPVVIMCGSSVKRGRLVPEPSRILISPGLGFVTAYMIELSGQGVLSDGDSGSWVISEYTQDLLGHIVATDALGTGYFIPAEDIFNDIVRNRLAVAVTLPTVHDFRLKKNEAQGGMNGMETKGRHSSSKGKQASLLPYLDGPELFYKDGIKFPCLDNIKSLNGVIGNAIFQSKHENSANASDAGKEMVGYDSDESLKQLTSTSIERGMRGLDVVVITTGSRRFRSVVNAIAASGGYEGIRFTSVSDQIIDKSCHYAFQFPGSSSARDAVRVFRCLLADVESGVSLKNLGLDKGSDPSQQSATKISDVFHLGTGSQEISSIYVSPGLHTPFHHRYTGHLSSIAEVSVSKLLGSMDISGQQDEVPISDAPKHQQELQSS
ncbi:hypothetical protein LEL_02916 [Akanthomyces lecanii RCEF 1005]|uniref:Uncharacterized protein n=1 Tax=Akanthomyces lecanii RCEF 1005 TaxID=1081108 RepID=A0A168IMB1_CORDF|nr:hypothetical protein LEL_02916 [Akanthomyces lecanii RCEF 1005]